MHDAAQGSTAGTPAVGQRPRGFRHIETWIFDLDNTLYPSSCNLFAQIDQRMGEFIANAIGVPLAHARHLQKAYYRQFGTTLAGLMKVHGLKPEPFLDYVHDIDLSVLPELPALRAAVGSLEGRRFIFTNGSRRHAEGVAAKIGILDLFDGIFDISACGFVPKPEREAFDKMIDHHGLNAGGAAMFEDMPHNLEVASELGMTTVLVHSDYIDHPAQLEMRKWQNLPPHIDYLTHDLADFLSSQVLARKS